MSVKALSWAFEQRLAGNEKCVLLAIADACDDAGVCWPKISTIAYKACVSERTVQRIIRQLEASGHITASTRTDGSRQTTSLYTLNMRSCAAPGSSRGDRLSPVRGDTVVTGEGDTVVTGEGDTVVTGEGDTVVTPYNHQNEPPDLTTHVASLDATCAALPANAVRPSLELTGDPPAKSADLPPYSDDFELFWSAYPKRDGGNSKKNAWRRFRSVLKTGITPESLITAARNYARHCEERRIINTEKVKMAEGWLNGGLYEDFMAAGRNGPALEPYICGNGDARSLTPGQLRLALERGHVIQSGKTPVWNRSALGPTFPTGRRITP